MRTQRARNGVVRVGSAALGLLVAASHGLADGRVAVEQAYVPTDVLSGAAGAFSSSFVVLFNRSGEPQDVSGWSLQVARGAAGFGDPMFKVDIPPATAPLSPGRFLLIRLAPSGLNAPAIPAPDVDAGGDFLLWRFAVGGGGAFALVRNSGLLPADACAVSNPDVEDTLGFGGATCFEGGAPSVPNATNFTAITRRDAGCTDTDDNFADFVNATPIPFNSASTASPCPGACCLPGGTCELLRPVDCQQALGLFNGVRIACAPPVVCGFFGGACCLPDGQCVVTTQQYCLDAGSLAYSPAQTCEQAPCTHSCCFPSGACVFLTDAPCPAGSMFGRYGDVCAPNLCAQPPRYACCFADGGCILASEFDCTRHIRLGVSACAPETCVGACCQIDGSCTPVFGPEACTWVFSGFGTSCEPNLCGPPIPGACCQYTGACVLTSDPPSCIGVFIGYNRPCFTGLCGSYLGACCPSQFACVLVASAEQCTGSGGVFGGLNVPCTPLPCAAYYGACCFPNGGCVVVSAPGDCPSTFAGFNTTCSAPCQGACCFSGGLCALSGPAVCGADFRGLGVACNPSPCPGAMGACCTLSGACAVVAPATCVAPDGYLGNGSACLPGGLCPVASGACCAPTGCELRLSSQCGFAFAAGVVCGPTTCQPGACCGGQGGGCFLAIGAMCPAAAFVGPGTVCSGAACSPGVCCAGATCFLASNAGACQGAYRQYVPGPSACGPMAASTPCCRADFNKLGGVSVEDLFNFLAEYFAGSPICDINGVSGVSVEDLFNFLAAFFAGCP